MGILDSIKKALAIGQSNTTPQSVEPTRKPLPDSFYIDTIEHSRAQKDTFFRTSPHSPIENRAEFEGLRYFPVDPVLRLTLPLERTEQPQELTIQTNTGDERPFLRIGTVSFEIEGEPAQLAIYQSEEHHDLFVPFRDATSGQETYGAGRYLEPEELPSDKILLDLNQAYNPFCAYSEAYSCPLPPFENHLKIAVRAGEKAYKK